MRVNKRLKSSKLQHPSAREAPGFKTQRCASDNCFVETVFSNVAGGFAGLRFYFEYRLIKKRCRAALVTAVQDIAEMLPAPF